MILMIMLAIVFFILGIENQALTLVDKAEKKEAGIEARGFESLFKEQIYALESEADFFSGKDISTEEEIKEVLSEINDLHHFNSIGFSGKDGKAVFSDDNELDVSENAVFLRALEGESAVSEELTDTGDGSGSIMIACPVKQEGGIAGVMFGTMSEADVSGLVNSVWDGESRLIVIDNGLNILGKSNNELGIKSRNKYDYYIRQYKFSKGNYQDVIALTDTGGEGSFRISFNNEEFRMILSPIGINNWYFVSYYSVKGSDAVTNAMMRSVVLFSILMAVVFGLMFYVFYVAESVMMELEDKNARYSIIANENKSITFSCNPNSRAVELNGAVEQAFGEEIAKMGTVDMTSLLDRLHESDQGLVKYITKAIRDGENKYETEVRIRKGNDDYEWYKLEAVIIRDKNNNTEKVVGSLKNSEDQIAKEHVLKNKAERDLLTGLLNKITMQNSVQEIIKQRPYSTFAFYIVDLDNFKAVNDNLGHAVGDKVLVDVANKLTLLFNEYDYLGRLGGDEFAVMLVIPENMSNYSSRLIELKAKSLCENLRETYSDENVSVTVSASIGISVYEKDGKSFEELYRHADQALYHSKNEGKNRYTFYSGEKEEA
ncbi:MAG: diguanylate cyclase [Lachnospiraceae bacterium]|nr:diguanylate cyclase [Lachnospiraceae bacterium]